jgi:preprotein translocase subunit YajC
MNILLSILLQAEPPKSGGGFGAFLPLILIIVVFYFFFIRPQTKKNKELKKFRENLKRGDRVITIGGIHGKVLEVSETNVVIEVEGQNRLKMEKAAIAQQYSGEEIAQK